jgi:hypothetical protein
VPRRRVPRPSRLRCARLGSRGSGNGSYAFSGIRTSLRPSIEGQASSHDFRSVVPYGSEAVCKWCKQALISKCQCGRYSSGLFCSWLCSHRFARTGNKAADAKASASMKAHWQRKLEAEIAAPFSCSKRRSVISPVVGSSMAIC